MSNKESHIFELSDELLDSLRQSYSNKNVKAADECLKSELAIAFAAGELQQHENLKFRNHLLTCNNCLNLVLDFQVAEIDSKDTPQQTAKVLAGLSSAIKKSKSIPELDSVFKKLLGIVSKYCSYLLSPKFIAVAATACFVFIIFNFGLNDPEVKEKLGEINKKITPQSETTEKYEDVRKKVVPPEKTKKNSPAFKLDHTSNQDSHKKPTHKNINANETDKTYDSTGKINPFEKLFRKKSVVAKKAKKFKRVPRTPLERIDLSQLKLVGIIISENGNKALFEEATGKGYVIKKDAYIGKNGGKVIEITKDKVIIEEKFEDVLGKITTRKIELKLQKR